jgi:tRNA(Leu) C34 or U34 (ribose-2'-O)-methylase TrmL
MLLLFKPLFGFELSHKTIERHNEDYRQRYKVTRGFKPRNRLKEFLRSSRENELFAKRKRKTSDKKSQQGMHKI